MPAAGTAPNERALLCPPQAPLQNNVQLPLLRTGCRGVYCKAHRCFFIPWRPFKGSGPSVSGGGGGVWKNPDFQLTKNWLFWERGIGWRRDNFSHEGMSRMTHWDPFGVRGAPTRCCTQKAHHLKKSPKIPIFGQGPPRSFIKPHWGSEVQNGFKHVFWTLNHPLWCLDDVSYRLRKSFALENFTQNDPQGHFCLRF